MEPQAGRLAFAPNLSWLLLGLPFPERLRAVVDAGFEAIEFGFPSRVDVPAIEAAHREYGLQVALFNQDVPVWDEENRGYLSDPGRRDEFRHRLDDGLELARRLDAHKLMLPAGVELAGIDHSRQFETIVENLRYAAPLAAESHRLLTIEVLNTQDNPGYQLTSWREAVEIVRLVDHPGVRFQFDTYHLSMLEGDLQDAFRSSAAWIGHIQFADFPARGAPGTGTIDFPAMLETIRQSEYRGFIGLEYSPDVQGIDALAWVPAEMRRLGRAASC